MRNWCSVVLPLRSLRLHGCSWLGALFFPEGVALLGVGGMAAIALVVLVFSLIPASIGFMLGMLGANTAVANSVGNIVGLAISFFGGAWFSISLMEPVVRDIAHWLPGLWYTQACQAVADLCTGAAGAQPSVLFIALRRDGALRPCLLLRGTRGCERSARKPLKQGVTAAPKRCSSSMSSI